MQRSLALAFCLLAAACQQKVLQRALPAIGEPCNVSNGISINADSPVFPNCENFPALVFPREACIGIRMPDEISRRVDSVSFTWSTPSDDVKSAKWSLRLKDFQRDVLAVPEGKMKKTVSTFENVNATTAEQEHFGFCFDGDDSNGSAYVYDWILNYRAN